jgi:hypothetical protein
VAARHFDPLPTLDTISIRRASVTPDPNPLPDAS